MSSGERPIGKEPGTEALCHPPPPYTHTHVRARHLALLCNGGTWGIRVPRQGWHSEHTHPKAHAGSEAQAGGTIDSASLSHHFRRPLCVCFVYDAPLTSAKNIVFTKIHHLSTALCQAPGLLCDGSPAERWQIQIPHSTESLWGSSTQVNVGPALPRLSVDRLPVGVTRCSTFLKFLGSNENALSTSLQQGISSVGHGRIAVGNR